jgi:hypothetical protein
MASTLNSAPTDRSLRGFATRRPEWFAVLASVYMLPLVALRLFTPEQTAASTTVWFAEIAWRFLVPTALLTLLGWWGVAGFTRRSTWRSLVPFLPLILFYVVVPVVVLPALFGVASHSLGYFTLVAVSALAGGVRR